MSASFSKTMGFLSRGLLGVAVPGLVPREGINGVLVVREGVFEGDFGTRNFFRRVLMRLIHKVGESSSIFDVPGNHKKINFEDA